MNWSKSKLLTLVSVISVATVSSLSAADEFANCAKADAIVIMGSKSSSFSSSDWAKAACAEVMLYPQKTVGTNDKTVNELMADAKGVKANVKALYNDKKVAFKISWKDATESFQGMTSDKYSDGVAMQFAVDSSDASKLPYIGMGSDGRPVVIYLQKSTKNTFEPNGNGDHKLQRADQSINKYGKDLSNYHASIDKAGSKDYQKVFTAEGFRSMTEIRDAKDSFDAQMSYAKGTWTASFEKSIKDDNLNLSGNEFPVALAIWDGAKSNRDGQKWLSGWVGVELGKTSGKISKALNTEPKGNAAKGKELASANCAACHNFDDQQMAMANMAPDLSMIGGQATAAYIKESIVDPDAVVVPGQNRNAHPNLQWYTLEEGKRVSAMKYMSAAMLGLSDSDVDDLVTYFKTLK